MNVTELRRRIRRRMKTRPYPYQLEGIEFTEKHKGRIINCDDMGLGKTLQTIGWTVAYRNRRPVIVVCPATIKFNWEREWKKHAGLRSYVCDGELSTPDQDRIALRKRIEELREEKKGYALRKAIRRAKKSMRSKQRRNRRKRAEVRHAAQTTGILIVNYDILESWLPLLLKLKPQILILDECHYVKNRSAKRTKACRILAQEINHVIALSGTPISGKPIEFFPVLNMVRPDEFPSFWRYAFQFCAPSKNRFSGGWDFDGTSNLDALRRRLKTVMIRRLKRKVLKDLPTKTRTILPVEITNRDDYVEAEENFLSWLLRRKGEEAWTRASRAEAIVRMNGLRQLSARGKLDATIRWIKDWLEETDQKLVVFAIHKVILKKLKKVFPRACVIDGTVSSRPIFRTDKKGRRYKTSKRQEMVDRFQDSPVSKKHRAKGDGILLGQLRAAGVGLNLTSASNVLFHELAWNPDSHDQGEDRVLRIGQKNKVSIYYMVGKNTIDSKLLTIIQAKDETVARILDGKKGGVMKLLHLFLRSAQKRRAA